ncbi:FAD-dependent oxidoreductase [Parabacteroides sp. AF17-28]|uniref:FAD-dependent oxidoreductase n=1 Tax=Parabacteroides sp. AF17-28 TaxID=2292241 RepID=UPI000F009D78|nr:FAD-dependent oxidoreductase [Parabacteroides sp. AF17-28]RHR60542.1 pyridine nucleotide-disulfide oxidoreductase [Parabacteroides sp. AF17-28]
MKYLIIGGVAGGATVAARLRRMDEKANIILFERGKYVSYANCGLPYYIGGTINSREKLFVQTVKGFTNRFRIDIRTEQEVTAIRPDKKEVEVKNLSTGETYTESYDKLVLSPGAEPLRPGIEGIGSKKIFTLRNVPDTDTIKAYVNEEKPKRAVVVGGGFIGLEMAENLHEQGIHVDVVEMANQVMAPLDFSMAAIVHQQLTDKGVGLHLEDGVSRFEEKDGGVTVHLRSGKQIATDMVLLSIGVRPETRLAKEAGLSLGSLGGIAVNEYMQTSAPDIYALGDAVEVRHLVTGKPALIPLAGPANKQGRIVADNIVYGNKEMYPGTMGTSIAKVFDLTVATAGANAKLLKREKIAYLSSYTHSASHAGYYPGAIPLSVKILFAPESGKLLGAQVVGFAGVDKRIEMLAQVIQRGGTVYDLIELEHAYAPPYSSAKDPVNMAGFVAENILKGKSRIIHWREIDGLSADTIRLDVRTREEYKLGTIPGFINIPVDELREHLAELPKEKPIVVTCAVGLRGYLAYRILTQNGFTNVRNLSGGYKTWSIATAPVKEIDDCPANSSQAANCGCSASQATTLKVDACGLMCPGPVMQLKKNYATLGAGEQLLITATDQAFGKDVASWCKMTGAELVSLENKNGVVAATIRKQEKQEVCNLPDKAADNKTLIVFSDDLDKALASFVIANGAASTGRKVTMFFTFWGLDIIKKHRKPAVSKDLFGKMFGWMLPAHSGKLKLSKMNMGGAGSRLMRLIMKKKRIDSLESLIQQAVDNGIEMIACTMSMDVMGIQKEELLDNVTLGGVASYLERAEEANVNLFI